MIVYVSPCNRHNIGDENWSAKIINVDTTRREQGVLLVTRVM